MNQKYPFSNTPSKDIIAFLDEVRIALDLSQQQMDILFLLLMKAEDVDFRFRIGNMNIIFGSSSSSLSDELDDKEITVEMCISQKNYANTISYKIPQVYLHSVKKKSSFVKST
jgi:hypothetical protein